MRGCSKRRSPSCFSRRVFTLPAARKTNLHGARTRSGDDVGHGDRSYASAAAEVGKIILVDRPQTRNGE